MNKGLIKAVGAFFQDFFGDLPLFTFAKASFAEDYSKAGKVNFEVDYDDANLIASKDFTEKHNIVLDLDCPHRIVIQDSGVYLDLTYPLDSDMLESLYQAFSLWGFDTEDIEVIE